MSLLTIWCERRVISYACVTFGIPQQQQRYSESAFKNSFIWAVVAVDWCSENMTSLLNQVHGRTGRKCSMVTSCHRNAPIVEKLPDRARAKKETYTARQVCWRRRRMFRLFATRRADIMALCSTHTIHGFSIISFNKFYVHLFVCEKRRTQNQKEKKKQVTGPNLHYYVSLLTFKR